MLKQPLPRLLQAKTERWWATKMTTHTQAPSHGGGRRCLTDGARREPRGSHRGFSGGSRRAEPVRRLVHHRATCLICSSDTNPAAVATLAAAGRSERSIPRAGLRVHRTATHRPPAQHQPPRRRGANRERREREAACPFRRFLRRPRRASGGERARNPTRLPWSLPTQPRLSRRCRVFSPHRSRRRA